MRRSDCLSCHAFGQEVLLDDRRRQMEAAASANLEEGVTCEACHGKAWVPRSQELQVKDWMGYHVEPSWHEASEQEWREHGMYDTRKPRYVAENCLTCHLGGYDRRVDHTMMGAGHPDLTFELATDLRGVPMHWYEDRNFLDGENQATYRARVWAIGQAVTLREQMANLLRTTASASTAIPDFAAFNCYTCHHAFLRSPVARVSLAGGAVVAREQMRPDLANLADTLPPGEPSANLGNWIVARPLVELVAPQRLADFDAAVAQLYGSLRLTKLDRDALRASAKQLHQLADELISTVEFRPFTRGEMLQLAQAIAGDAEAALWSGPYGIEQVGRALFVLCSGRDDALVGNAAERERLKQTFFELRRLIYGEAGDRRPVLSAFDADRFRRALATIAEQLATANQQARGG